MKHVLLALMFQRLLKLDRDALRKVCQSPFLCVTTADHIEFKAMRNPKAVLFVEYNTDWKIDFASHWVVATPSEQETEWVFAHKTKLID